MKNFIKSNLLYLIGGALGAIGGYVYYAVVGCQSGTCPITSITCDECAVGCSDGRINTQYV